MSALLDSLLDAARRAECARHEPEPAPSAGVRGDYRWPDVPWRTEADAPSRRRSDPPRHSRFGDLQP